MWNYFLIGLGGAVGSIARYWMSGLVAQRLGETFPFGTLTVNALGSFLIGLVFAFGDTEGRFYLNPAARQFLMLGILGGFTTFSSFSLQTLNLVREREWLYAGGNVAGSVVLCLVGVWLGFVLAQALNSVKGS